MMKQPSSRDFRSVLRNLALWITLLLPYFLLGLGFLWHRKVLNEIASANVVIIDKAALTMSVISYQGKKLGEFPISVGMRYGNKQKQGDLKTPEGVFQIVSIENSTKWKYDFEDDNLPAIQGAYGPLFLRLNTPHQGIGIHGTHDSTTIGFRSSHGCIRMKNVDLVKLKSWIKLPTTVIIVPSRTDQDSLVQESLTNIKSNR